jgi:hypothetical protein
MDESPQTSVDKRFMACAHPRPSLRSRTFVSSAWSDVIATRFTLFAAGSHTVFQTRSGRAGQKREFGEPNWHPCGLKQDAYNSASDSPLIVERRVFIERFLDGTSCVNGF